MATIGDLEGRVQDRLEELRGGPLAFWGVQTEIRPLLVEAMYMATLITGEPEVRQTQPTTISANTTVLAAPSGSVAMLKIEAANGLVVKKESLWSLSQMIPTWEGEKGDNLKHWFPIGLNQYGVYPQLNASAQVIITYVAIPVTMPTTSPIAFTGNEVIPLQVEYLEGLEDYAAALARLKEATQEFFDGLRELDRFLSRTWELSKYATRKGSLRFTRSKGVESKVTDVIQR